jgi:hypothetical protein
METTKEISARSLQYYVIARRWLSDLEFFKQESNFLRHLLQRHMLHIQNQEHMHELIVITNALEKLEVIDIYELLAGQLRHLELMAEDIIPEDTTALAATQVKLEYYMSNLTKQFRLLKQDIFKLVLGLRHAGTLIAN